VAAMTDAADHVRFGEVTTAIKDSSAKVGRIKAGQVIGIADHEIVAVGADIDAVSEALLDAIAGDGTTLTLLAGRGLSDDRLADIATRLGARHPALEVETHRGEQPLYPIIMSVE
jgi:uncharacterized protein